MKTRLYIIIGIVIAVSSLFTIAYFTNEGLDVERCNNDIVYKDFTGEIVLREKCVSPFTGITITDTFLGCEEGFKQVNETCITTKLVEKDPNPTKLGGPIIFDKELRKELKEAKNLIKKSDIPYKILGVGLDHIYIQMLQKDSQYESKIAEILKDIPYKLEYGEGIKRGTIPMKIYPPPANLSIIPYELQNMLSDCNIWRGSNSPLIDKTWQNDTHIFSMPECEWKLK